MKERSTESVPADAAPTEILADWPTGRIVADRYEIGPVLGVGGSSVIYRAFDRTLQQPVALKVLRRDRVSPAATGRLRREVSVARNAVSPHLVRVFDIDTAVADTFVTMELIDGESLRARLERGPLPIAEILAIAKQLLRGLSTLHKQNVIHRDIKPSNVLIDGNGIVKLADFGLAVDPTAGGDRPTQTGTLVGTAEYMSPEQVMGAALDARSDLYSFGVLLYECLTGELPFGSKSSVAALLAHVRERPRSVRQLRPEVPKWLSRFVDRLLAKEAAMRLSSADAALRMLEAERVPRNLRTLAAVVAAVAIVAAGLAGLSVMLTRRPSFAHLSKSAGGGIEAVDTRGTVLWRNASVDNRRAAVVRLKDGKTWIAAISLRGTTPASRPAPLQFLNPETGVVEWSVDFWDVGKATYPQYPDYYFPDTVTVFDFDHDGDEEVVCTFVHRFYWPSYAIVYDVARRSERLTFVNSGGIGDTSAADVNGDGRDDLLLRSINNRFGWYAAIAAIDVKPLSAAAERDIQPLVSSPDTLFESGFGQRALLWYALVPPQWNRDPLQIDAPRHRISGMLTSTRTIEIGFDGFLLSSPSSLPRAERAALRDRAYGDLRLVNTSLTARDYTLALETADRALASAVRANDLSLQEYCRRVRIRVLIRLGRMREASQELDALMAASTSSGEIAFDAAREAHLAGRLDDACRWYRAGLLASRDNNMGRLKYEFVQGGVLALGEERRWRDAEELIDLGRRIIGSFSAESQYINYIHWRRGGTSFLPVDVTTGDPDLARYWDLEFRHAAGLRGTALLEAVDLERKQTNLFSGLLESIRSVALAESGRMDEARRNAEDALAWTTVRAETDTAVRAHLDIVRERAKALGVTTGG